MWQHLAKLTFRNILKNKTLSTINFLGLSIGLAAVCSIALYVYHEWQTDRSFPHPERTYRLLRVGEVNGEQARIGTTASPFGPALQDDYPSDIEAAVRVLPGGGVIQIDKQQFSGDDLYYVDAGFMDFFGFELLHGDPATALAEPYTIVLTSATAKRYFGNPEAAMGQTLRIDNSYEAKVTGVLQPITDPTHLDFDLLESTLSLEEADWWSSWGNNNLTTYVRLAPNVKAETLESRFPAFMDKYLGQRFAETGQSMALALQPIRSVYLDNATKFDRVQHGNRSSVLLFLFAALLLLFIACANYINLATAKVIERQQDVAVQRILGSGQKRIAGQALLESGVFALLAVVTAAALTALLLPYLESFLNLELNVSIAVWQYALAGVGIVIILTLLAGIYPAWLLASQPTAAALKTAGPGGNRQTMSLRKVLIVTQFVLSIGLICCTFIIQKQLVYVHDKDLGFDEEQILLIPINNFDIFQQKDRLQERVERIPGSSSSSFVSAVPGGHFSTTSVKLPGSSEDVQMRTAFMDPGFMQTFDFQLSSGRALTGQLASDTTKAIMLNEQAVKTLGLTTDLAIGQKLYLPGFDSLSRTVVGVVEDYHFASLREAVEPLVISTGFFWRQPGRTHGRRSSYQSHSGIGANLE